MKIYIGFSKPTTKLPLFGWLIQWVENRPYDHVYIRLQEPKNKEYIIFQASKEMVNIYNKDIFLKSNKSLKEYEINITDSQYDQLWNFVVANLGIPYSLLEDLGILLMKIFKIKQLFNSGMSAEFCSKLGAIVCNIFGIKIDKDPGSIDPRTLDQILSDTNLPFSLNPVF